MAPRSPHPIFGVTLACLGLASPAPARAQAASDIQGVWAAERYHLAEGVDHEVEGRIFFTARDWQVLFFVVDEGGVARRGSGEGGTYTLDGSELVLTHLFNLSAGVEMPGLPATELRMASRRPEDAPVEPTRVDLERGVLTLHFPSGNRMTFGRR